MTAREMQQEKAEQHSSEQREENNVLLRSMAGMMKMIGGAIVALLMGCIGVGAADHFKLISLGESVARLTASTDRAAADATVRNEAHAAWRSNIESRLQILEIETRQSKKP